MVYTTRPLLYPKGKSNKLCMVLNGLFYPLRLNAEISLCDGGGAMLQPLFFILRDFVFLTLYVLIIVIALSNSFDRAS